SILPYTTRFRSDDILRTLEAFVLYWDETVVYQSKRTAAYQETLDNLQQKDWLYPCTCSRQQIAAHGRPGQDGFIYPGTCRQTGINETDTSNHCFAWRIHTREQSIQFHDLRRRQLQLDLPYGLGEFVLLRSDGIVTYELAIAVDAPCPPGITVHRGPDP